MDMQLSTKAMTKMEGEISKCYCPYISHAVQNIIS